MTTTGSPETDTSAPHEISVAEPAQPRRVRRQTDLLRLLFWLVVFALALLLGALAVATASGLEEDIASAGKKVPSFLVVPVAVGAGLTVLGLPLVFTAERLVRRKARRVADAVIAAVLTHVAALGLTKWIVDFAPQRLEDSMTHHRLGTTGTEPLHIYLASIIAYVTIIGLDQRPRLRDAFWIALAVDAVVLLVSDQSTPSAIVASIALGRIGAFVTRYAIGTPNSRPSGKAVVETLAKVGVAPLTARRVADTPEENRRYEVRTASGPALDVIVLDRDQQTAGVLYRIWRRIRLRGDTQRRPLVSLRRALEHEALITYAAASAGANTPRLVGAVEVGPDAAALAYLHCEGRTLDTLADEELSDDLLRRIWRQLAILHAKRVVHRNLTGKNILVDADGRVWLLDMRSGDIAANELLLRLDIVQLLTTLALRVGPDRAVDAAASVLGEPVVAAAMPLLQPVVLTRETRAVLRQQREVLPGIRDRVLTIHPHAEVEPAKLERIRPRTLFTVLAGTAAGYFLLSQLAHVDLIGLVTKADWKWGTAALGAAATSYVGAAIVIMGFVPGKLPLVPTFLAQLASSFAKLVAPPAVGTVAVNTRYLQRSGIPPAMAVASVSVSQIFSLCVHVTLLLIFGYITGIERSPELPAATTVITVLLAVALVALLVVATPHLRRLVASRVAPIISDMVPRMLDVLQQPSKLALGVGGNLLLTLSFVLCLVASVRAFGGEVSIASVALVFLAGSAIGSAAPTPGGLGAVEAAMSAGLTAAGLPGEIAVSAVLLFRLATFWLPVAPGYLAFTYLQRHEKL